MKTQIKIIKINNIQKEFILKAIENIYFIYDFENLNNKEFKEIYNTSKEELNKSLDKLKEVLK